VSNRTRPLHVIFDTDIGSDVDDALALALLLGSPEVELLGITSVYGDTLLRARIASRLIALAAGQRAIPCIPGSQDTLTGRDIWWAGHEGSTMDDLQTEPTRDESAIGFLIRHAGDRQDLHVISTAPLTNLARAIQADPGLPQRVASLTVMGGAFGPTGDGRPEHNFASDPEAADIVIRSGIPLVLTGLEITRQLTMAQSEVDQITAAGPLGAALGREIDQWWKFNGEQWNVPHDPVAVLTLLTPELFSFEPKALEVDVAGAAPGTSRAASDPSASSRVVTGLDTSRVAEAIVERIIRAGTGPARG
jgi:purine nucleosidase